MNNGITGAIIGDIISSRFLVSNSPGIDFVLFTDWSTFTGDTVMSIATAEWLSKQSELSVEMHLWGYRYDNRCYSEMFHMWLFEMPYPHPYNSFGSGAARRVVPVGLYAKDLEEALSLATKVAEITHNHPEGIKSAQIIASVVFLARSGKSKDEIKDYLETTFGYDLTLSRTVTQFSDNINVVQKALVAFFESDDYESAIRFAVAMKKGDERIAIMAGGIAAAFYGVPQDLLDKAWKYIPDEMHDIIEKFEYLCNQRSIVMTLT